MTKQVINVGTVANDGTGDTIRSAMVKTNANFTEVYGKVDTLETNLTSNLTAGEFVYSDTESTLRSVSGLSLDQYGTIRYDRTSNTDSLPALTISDTLNTVLSLVEYSDSDSNAPALALVKRRGSILASQAAIAGDLLGVVSAIGIDGSSSGRVLWKASSTTSPTTTNSMFEIQTKVGGVLGTYFQIGESGQTIVNSLQFPDSSSQSSAAISIADLKTLVAASTDFADFQSRIAAL